MRVIYNNWFPFGTYRAINMLGIIFAKRKYGKLNKTVLNHEYIHSLQQREMLFVFFYMWYVMEWLVKLCKYRNTTEAYYNISFEREAYAHQRDLNYDKHRPLWAWTKYVRRR